MKSGSGKSVTGGLCESLQSNLLAAIFETLPVNKRLLVLDMGAAIGSIVNFFNKFKCRLSFADLCAGDFVVYPCGEATHSERVSQFQHHLNLPAGTKIDICLFWDLFGYLDGPTLMAPIEALDAHISSDTLRYSIGVRNADTPLPFFQYGIERSTQLSQANRGGIQPKRYPRSQRDPHHLLSYFEIDKCRLLAGTRVEYLLIENRHHNTKPQLNF